MVLITLKSGSTEKTLAQWGYSSAELTLRSLAASTFTVRKGGDDPASAPDVAFKGLVTIYRDRVFSGGAWSGGTVIFVGRRIAPFEGSASPDEAFTTLTFADGWWDLQNIIFQHVWRTGTNGAATTYSSRLNLFQDISAGPTVPWITLTVDKQLQEIVNYAQTDCGANVQIGATDPAWAFPFFGVKAISCADAIRTCLKSIPDCVSYFDYTTSPPTINFKQAVNLAAVTLPYAGTDAHGRMHQSTRIKSREDLQLPQVVIQYQTTTLVDGIEWTSLSYDAYPSMSTGQAIGAMVVPIDMRGGTRNDVSGSLTSVAIDPTTTAFWKTYKPELANAEYTSLAIFDTTINGGSTHPDGITCVDSTGSNVSLSGAKMLIKGTVAAWMAVSGTPIVSTEVTISAVLSYTKSTNINTGTPASPAWIPEKKVEKHRVNIRCRLTNSAAGTVGYSALALLDPGDPAITGLAENIYNSFNTLQYEGEHTIVDDALYQIVGPGHVLNLTGGSLTNQMSGAAFNSAWSTMAAVIYESTTIFGAKRSGLQTIRFGPHRHLTAKEFYDFIMMWSWRRIYDNPNVRNTGADGSQANTTLGADTQKENTQHGLELPSLQTVSSLPASNTSTTLQTDAVTNGGQILFQNNKIVSGAAVQDPDYPVVQLSQDDLYDPVTDDPLTAKWRVCTLATGDKILVAATDDFDAGGGGWKGAYSGSIAYNLGDIVLYSVGGDSDGIYVWNNATASTPGTAPVYPPAGSHWQLFAFLAQTIDYDDDTCTAQSRYVNASPQL